MPSSPAGETIAVEPARARHRPSRAALFLSAPLLASAIGCGDASAREENTFAVRDSAGIQIVESAASAWGAVGGWRLAAEPATEIGLADGSAEYLLTGVTSARQMRDGTIVVANGGSNEIRFYDASGRHMRTVGGQGGGPGEFQRLDWIEVSAGDSVIAYDRSSRRVSTFSPSGEFVRSVTLGGDSETGYPQALGAFADASLLVRTGRVVQPDEVRSGVTRSDVTFLRYSSEGELLDSLAILPGNEAYLHMSAEMISIQTLLLGRSTSAAVTGDRVYLGASDSFNIGLYAGDGRLERLIRRRGALRPVTPADVDRVRQERIDRISEGPWKASQTAMLAEMPKPETHPAFSTFLADEAGNLWVEESRLPGEPALWSVFDGDGRLLGSLELPQGFRPSHIGSDFVLGIATDELEVQRVRLYAIEKP